MPAFAEASDSESASLPPPAIVEEAPADDRPAWHGTGQPAPAAAAVAAFGHYADAGPEPDDWDDERKAEEASYTWADPGHRPAAESETVPTVRHGALNYTPAYPGCSDYDVPPVPMPMEPGPSIGPNDDAAMQEALCDLGKKTGRIDPLSSCDDPVIRFQRPPRKYDQWLPVRGDIYRPMRGR